jgi:hypothetical protein
MTVSARFERGRMLHSTSGQGLELRPQRKPGAQKGQTLVEFALVAPMVLFFLLAIVDFGIAIDRRLVLDHAVREGARYAAVGSTVADVKERTRSQSQGIADPAGTPGSDNYIVVCYEDTNSSGDLGDVGDNVEVRVHYRHDFVTGFTGLIGSSLANISMNPSGSARVERKVVPAPTEPAAPCGAWPPS